MTFEEFRQAVKSIAGDSYHAVSVEISDRGEMFDNRVEIQFGAYIHDVGWTYGPTADSVLKLCGKGGRASEVPELGELPRIGGPPPPPPAS